MKYYYDSPIKAAWMAEQFKIKFKSAGGQDMHFDGSCFRVTKECGVYGGEKYLVHPGSYDIFKPKDNDGGIIKRSPDGLCFDSYYIFSDEWKDIECRNPESEPEIIRRDSKAFFMPEGEL